MTSNQKIIKDFLDQIQLQREREFHTGVYISLETLMLHYRKKGYGDLEDMLLDIMDLVWEELSTEEIDLLNNRT